MAHFLNDKVARTYKGKVALVRVDLNIEKNSVEGLYRLRSAVPTIKLLRKHGVRVVIISHKGRPNGVERELTLKPFVPVVTKEIGEVVKFLPTFDFEELREEISSSKESVFMLENIRFLKGEESDDAKLAKQLATLGNVFINEAFAVSHRAHASVHAITEFLPSFGGLQLEKEIRSLSEVMKKTEHPFVFVLGGAKVADKLPLIAKFKKKADIFLMGGGPGNTLLAAEGVPMDGSLYDKHLINEAKQFAFSAHVMSPSDARCDGENVLDIGEETAIEYAEIIRAAKMIVWNGPMGLFEKKAFSKGTAAVWTAVLKNKKARIIIGGGETIASLSTVKVDPMKVPKNIFLSTGGGAMLEYLAGQKLPGIVAIK
jgi:3-phosphoglycerate kinase